VVVELIIRSEAVKFRERNVPGGKAGNNMAGVSRCEQRKYIIEDAESYTLALD